MIISSKSATIKGYANRKHKFEIERTSVSGHEFFIVKKNGKQILLCEPAQYKKLQLLFTE